MPRFESDVYDGLSGVATSSIPKFPYPEEYLGLDVEGADHRRYFDITPLILLAGIAFVIMRFIGLGTGDQALYIFGGIAAAVFLGLSRLLYNLPPEDRRIR